MIVKMIQNLEIKMELQINSLETRIEKMQERFNKDLEEIKKSQYIMNNAIWWAAVYGVTQSWTRLKQLSSSILVPEKQKMSHHPQDWYT